MIRRTRHAIAWAAVALLCATTAYGQGMKEREGLTELDYLVVRTPDLNPQPVARPLEQVPDLTTEVRRSWQELSTAHPGWRLSIDVRSGHLEFAEGPGTPWIPGWGNRLTAAEVSYLDESGVVSIATLENLARSYLEQYQELFGIAPEQLVLDPAASGAYSDYLWFVEFDLYLGNLPVEGARLTFRINNGNLIQVGTANLPSRGVTAPPAQILRRDARRTVTRHIRGFQTTDEWLDRGSQHLIVVAAAGAEQAEQVMTGHGYALRRVWQFLFRRPGVSGTWRAWVDATNGELVAFEDINAYAEITGGVYPVSYIFGDETEMAMPFADTGQSAPDDEYASSAGLYTWSGGSNASTLNGPYVYITDDCGSGTISETRQVGTGDISFGTSAGTDCTTPGHGGDGNTHSSRMQYYHINRLKEKARAWLPSNTWLQAQLEARVNINSSCNANWDYTRVNFFRSDATCANTGEVAGISLHEVSHGLDTNDGNGFSPDKSTGETYGDFSGATQIRTSCMGDGFWRSGGDCSGYGDACTSCSGVRDIDWCMHSSQVPHTPDTFIKNNCIGFGSCPGNCGGECHCESYPSSEAMWDLATKDLVAGSQTCNASYPDEDGPYTTSEAWSAVDRIWYLSRPTAGRAFSCSGSPNYTSHGCIDGSYFRVLRAVDDDNGDTTDGTPHSCYIAAAFQRHEMECTSDTGWNTCYRGCTPPGAPSLAVTGGDGEVWLDWTSSGSNVRYDLFRNEAGCDRGFTKIAEDLELRAYRDTELANGATYYYQVTAQPIGNEACSSSPSACGSATPASCSAPAVPGGVGASSSGANEITVSWSLVGGADSYHVWRSATSGGPYTWVGTSTTSSFADTEVSGGTVYYYVVRGVSSGCESGDSSEVSATAAGTCTTDPTFAGITSLNGLSSDRCGLRLEWSTNPAETYSNCEGELVFNVYRSTQEGFTPNPLSNLVARCVTGSSYEDADGISEGTKYYYVVRAEDAAVGNAGPCGDGNEESNTVELGRAPGTVTAVNHYSNDFEGADDWTHDKEAGGDKDSWVGIQECPASGGDHVYVFGNSSTPCSGNYQDDAFAYAGPASWTIPANTINGTVELSFDHKWETESDYDGVLVAADVSGSGAYVVEDSCFKSGPDYSGTIIAGGGFPPCESNGTGLNVWTGTSSGYPGTEQHSVLDLDCHCDTVRGVSGEGCGGQTVQVLFYGLSDCSANGDGWFLDNVSLDYETVGSCSAPPDLPDPLQFFTARSSDGQNLLEWRTPASGSCASHRVRILRKTSSYPTAPGDGTEIYNSYCTGNGSNESYTDSGCSNGQTCYYAGFFYNETSTQYSSMLTVSGRPQNDQSEVVWIFNTGATNMAPPGIGSLYGVSNDRTLHSLTHTGDATGGLWPTGWAPVTMGAPSQGRMPVVSLTFNGVDKWAWISSQDGYVYGIDATSGGTPEWSTEVGGVLQAPVSAAFSTHGEEADLLFIGTRDAGTANKVCGLNPGTGAIQWTFTNSGSGDIGIISGSARVDYENDCIYFASRRNTTGTGSSDTVWCLDYSGTKQWSQAHGDIDGSPSLRSDYDYGSGAEDRLYVGTVSGVLRALRASDGIERWSRDLGDGPIKYFVYPDKDSAMLYLATNDTLWGVRDDDTTSTVVWSQAVPGTSFPMFTPGGTHLYSGSSNGSLYQLDLSGAPDVTTLQLGDGTAAVGVPALRVSTPALLFVGTESGAVYAVELPL